MAAAPSHSASMEYFLADHRLTEYRDELLIPLPEKWQATSLRDLRK
jgi:hypothetical protein